MKLSKFKAFTLCSVLSIGYILAIYYMSSHLMWCVGISDNQALFWLGILGLGSIGIGSGIAILYEYLTEGK